ncbi:hypothetical protein OSB04_007654 [Centaurea solstitialis]|uniref:CCHC-type domain-containing protein n=1 Tax=Centaurea solstitialis TaxID=347529 RepID=A0AA38TLZ5_9ASTR|nr:hypothetical protein OSB04_007654 [Centaurea solstitialis]
MLVHCGTSLSSYMLERLGTISYSCGFKFEDEIQGLWILGTLPDSWETFRTSLSNSAPDGVISMELAKGSILNEEMRRKSQGSSSQSDVLVTESRGRSHSRGPSNRRKNRSKSKRKFGDFECYNCGRKGHTTRFCRQLKRENKKANYNNQKNNQKKDDGVSRPNHQDHRTPSPATPQLVVTGDCSLIAPPRHATDRGRSCGRNHTPHHRTWWWWRSIKGPPSDGGGCRRCQSPVAADDGGDGVVWL